MGCHEHWGACFSSNYSFFWVYAQEENYWIIWHLYFQFFEEPSYSHTKNPVKDADATGKDLSGV